MVLSDGSNILIGLIFCIVMISILVGAYIYEYKKKDNSNEKTTFDFDQDKKELEEMEKAIEEKNKKEDQKNKDIDISKFPFCIEFEKEFNMSFQDFKNSLKKIKLSKDSKRYDSITFIYNDKYFYVEGLYGYDKEVDAQSTLSKNEFEEIITNSNKTDYVLKVYEKAKVSDFKKFLYSLDDLLYIQKYNDVDEWGSAKTPSKLSLAVTESLYGTAAAMKKLNKQEESNKTYYCGGKFVFSEKTNLPILYCVSMGKSLILLSDEEKLFNLKSYERYQERMLKDSVKESNTNSSLDEIKKLKELLDCGAITQEEFDSKKKELLNLK